MIFLPNYQIQYQIYEGIDSKVYRGIREFDQQKVIIKLLNKDYPTISELNHYKQEYKITKNLNIDGVVKVYSLEKYQNTLAIILEDFGAESLKVLLNNRSFCLCEFLQIAVKIATVLEKIHTANIIHKDLNSHNILYNPNTEELKITNFGIATLSTKEKYTGENLDISDEKLAYISPEQTGRINLYLDYRTDFYSLGITFYELLTGILPFDSQDPLELFHCHLAKTAVKPSEINPSIPLIISDLVMKLIAKNSENRYQSAWGLKKDLQNCLQQLESTETINYFPLGSQDICDKFLIPNKLYGRDEVITTLLNKREKLADQSSAKIIFIGGYSGIGKSSLVEQIYKQINQKKSYFISGKCEQFQQHNPYSALVNAFQQLVKQKLTENQENLDAWKNKLLENLGINGQIIVDIIPEIELIIGKQLPTVKLSPKEAENRFYLVFQKFIEACCTKKHPLVIFLDDLQWADNAVFKLIELTINNSNLQHLLLIGAYRNNEINQDHSLIVMVDNIIKNKDIVNQINLENLTLNNVSNLIADTLKSDINKVKDLSELVLKKTGGNHFFTKQFLQTLYIKKLIYFDYNQYQWQWDIKHISSQNITDNVVELMIYQLKTFPESTQSLLQLSACIGNQFSLSTLSIIEQKFPEKILQDLIIAIDSGLILPLSVSDEGLIDYYQFLHDRVQQAAYALIPEDKKPQIHLKIGNLLIKKYSDLEKEENLFQIVGHLNKGRKFIDKSEEKEHLAKLNLEAGNKAKKSNAYQTARIYLQTGLELLNPDGWHSQYDLSLNLYTASAEIAYLNADSQEMEFIIKQVLDNARNILDKITIYKISIASYTAQSNMEKSIIIGRKALRELGIELPISPNIHETNNALKHLDSELESRNIEELINLPINNNPQAEAIIEILGMLYSTFYQSMPNLIPFVSSTMVSLSLKFGNLSASAIGYCIHGMVLCSFFGEIKKGYSFGKLAMNLIEISPQQQFQALTIQTFGCIIQCRQELIRNSLTTLDDSYKIALETGDLMNGGYTALIYCFTGFFAGVELETLEIKLENYHQVLTELKQDSAKTYLEMIWQTIKNLREITPQPHCLKGSLYNETIRIPQHETHQELTAIAQVYIYKLLLAYHFGNYQSAQEYINKAQPFLASVAGIVFFPCYYFYAALTYIARWETQENKREILQKLEYHHIILYQWAEDTPVNYKSKWHLVEAEKQRILGNKAEAIEHYDQGIKLAKESQFINELAIANELAGKFYLSWEKEKLAQYYFQESLYYYTLWGATAKIADLEQTYPQFFPSTTTSPNAQRDGKITNGSNSSRNLDLITILKASQAIASEIVLENLLQTLMQILLENAGVQTGCLLLHTPNSSGELGTFTIAIHSCNHNHNLDPDQIISENVPESIVYYVARTQEYICLDRAIAPLHDRPDLMEDFMNDPYIQSVQPFSILCYPLLNQKKLVGIVYLENNLTTGSCTTSGLELLQLLSGQAAIAINNAQLYNQVKQNEELLKQFLEAMPLGIGVLDANGNPYYTNQKGKYILGKEVISSASKEKISEVYGIYVSGTKELYPYEDLCVVRALQGQVSTADDLEIHNGDRIIPIESWGTPIYDESGRVLYAMGTFQDITQRKETDKMLRNYSRTLEKEVLKRTNELQKANEQLSRLANLDGLTQVANRRRFDDYLKNEWQRHLRQQQPLSLILMDIDYFKPYNDTYGHQEGDNCLIRVAQKISNVVQRPTDLFARYGGEEFAIILPETSPHGALIVAESVKKAIDKLQIPHVKSGVSQYVTLSMGVANIIPTPQLTPENLITQADEALYQAKNEGRNRVIGN